MTFKSDLRNDTLIINKPKNIKPFLRWVGGKTWLIRKIRDLIPSKFNNYHECFLGGGSFFLYVQPKQYSFLSDINKELINTYIQVKNNPKSLYDELSVYKNNKTTYKKYCNVKFNDPLQEAARFIYLNKTSFNGIYRVNSKGVYNVPYGRNKYKEILDRENLNLVSELLQKATLKSIDFKSALLNVQRNDFVFLDPPYTTAHKNNGFIEYNQKLFTWQDQEYLAEKINDLIKKKAKFILCNASHPKIDRTFKNSGRKIVIERTITVGGKFATRQIIEENIFTNIL